MIEEQPEDWGNPLGDWYDKLVTDKPKVIKVKVLTPNGVREFTPSQINASEVLGLSVRRIEDGNDK